MNELSWFLTVYVNEDIILKFATFLSYIAKEFFKL